MAAPAWQNPIFDLHDALNREQVVAVAGAGISKAAAGLPGWRAAVDLAIGHLENVGTATIDQVSSLRGALTNATTIRQLIACATSVRELLVGSSLSSGEFASWLRQTFDVPTASVSDWALLHSLVALPATSFTTTNYDKLIERSRADLESVTWRQGHLLHEALTDRRRIVHLHGVWDDPDSVVFGAQDYARVVSDPAYQAFLQTLWLDRTLLFIGCSFDGIKDPDFLKLLDWMTETFPHATNRHFALVRSNTYTPEQAGEFLNRWRIQLVPFGERHEDLVPFLNSLAPQLENLSPAPPRVFVGREIQIAQIAQSILDGRSILIHGMGGIGKSTLLAKALADFYSEHSDIRQIWLRSTASTVYELCRDVGRQLGLPDINALEDHELVRLLLVGLANSHGIMVVVDDCDITVIRSFVRDCLPAGVALVAASRSRTAGFDEYLEVDPLENESADQLFVDTAGVTGSEDLVRQICSLLGNHPLAIVLAAGRYAAESLPLERIFIRLSEEKHRLDALRDPEEPDSPNRSVRASLALSLDGLSDGLIETLAILARFYADTSISLLASALRLDSTDCEDRVGSLVSRSLARRSPSGAVHLHELIRDFTREQTLIEASKYEEMIEVSIVSLINRLDRRTFESHMQLLDDLDNLIGFILSTTEKNSNLRKAAAVAFVLVLCQPHGILRLYGIKHARKELDLDMLSVTLSLVDPVKDSTTCIMLLVCRGHVLASQHQTHQAIQTVENALEIAVSNGQDLETHASVKCELGNAFLRIFNYPAAEAMMRDGLADAIGAHNSVSEAQLTGQLAHVLMVSGQLDESEELYLKACRLYENSEHPLGVAACMGNLADIAMKRGNPEHAWDYGCAGLFLEIEANYLDGALHTLEQLSTLCINETREKFVMEQIDRVFALLPYQQRRVRQGLPESMRSQIYLSSGRYLEAKALLVESLDIRRRNSDKRGEAVALGNLSYVARRLGEPEEAWSKNQQSMDAYLASGDVNGLRTCRHNGATMALELGHIDIAVDWMCEDIRLSAQMRDLDAIVHTFHFFFAQLEPRLIVKPQLMVPKNELEFPTLMLIMDSAAGARNLGLMVGTLNQLVIRYGPGGTPSNVPDWLKQ